MKRARIWIGLNALAVTAVAALGATATAGAQPAAPQAAVGSGCSGNIGIIGPFTGPAASIGQEQLKWARFGIKKFNQANGTSFKLNEQDSQLDAKKATTAAAKLIADKSIVGIVGPAGSQEVLAIGPLTTRAKIAYVSMSATRTDLTAKNKYFYRVVPNDDAQSPTTANFISKKLSAKKVVIIDDQEPYSTGLADAVGKILDSSGVDTTRDSVAQKTTDFSALVSKIGSDVDVVYLPWQLAPDATTFANQMKEQGKTAKLVGSDGLFSGDFKAEGAYVTSFAPDIKSIASVAPLVKEFTRQGGGKFGTFGPPTYLAAQAMASAANKSCEDGKASRSGVLGALGSVKITKSILGSPFAFSNREVKGAKFYLFRQTGGKFVLVK